MRQDNLLHWTRKQPFEPFVVHLTDGAKYEVRHPDMIMPMRGEVFLLALPHANDPNRGEKPIMLSYFHLTKVEALELPEKQTNLQNGTPPS